MDFSIQILTQEQRGIHPLSKAQQKKKGKEKLESVIVL